MAKQGNIKTMDHVKLQQIKSDSKTMSITKLAKAHSIGYAAAKNAVQARNLKHFKELMASYNTNEAKASQQRRAAKKQNDKAQGKAAEKVVENATQTYSDQQVKALIDGLVKHTGNLEERLQTVVSLLVESDDNVISRIYNLETKRGFIRRFLERF